MMRKPLRGSMAIGAIAVFALVATACGSDPSPAQQAAPMECLQQLSDQDYVTVQQSLTPESTPQAQTVNVVCVAQDDGIHYYDRDDDNISSEMFLAYALMGVRGGSLAAMGMLSGMDPFHAIVLSHLLTVGNDGYYSHPYQRTSDGRYARSTYVDKSVKVTNVYYGSEKKSLKDALSKPNKQYSTSPWKKVTDQVAKLSSSKGGKLAEPVVLTGKSTKAELKKVKLAPPPAFKSIKKAPVAANPARKSSSRPSTGPKPTLSTPAKPTSRQATPTTRRQTPTTTRRPAATPNNRSGSGNRPRSASGGSRSGGR